ncbi:MAG: hypothetical protein ACYSR8_12385 [Planctomycetota bacterium]
MAEILDFSGERRSYENTSTYWFVELALDGKVLEVEQEDQDDEHDHDNEHDDD